jgi:predicted ATPase
VPEKRLFRRIGIFVDGWTLPAAHKICADDMCVSEDDVFETLSSLVDKSLVVIERRNDTKLRYRMLETIRSYALDHLEEAGERQDIARRHADYFRMLAEHADETTHTTERLAWIAAFEHELDNFRAALSWCLIEGNEASVGAALAGALGLFFVRLNLGQEAARWCEIGLARLVEHPQPLREAALYHALARAYNTTVGPHQGRPMAALRVNMR